MLTRIIQIMMVLTTFHLHAGQIVLKNGKKLVCDGPYEVKGKMLQYKKDGNLFQLPLKIVDLDKSSKDVDAPKVKKKDKDVEVLVKSNDPKEKRRNVAFHDMVDHDVVTTENQAISIDEAAMAKKYKTDDMHGVNKYEKRLVHFFFWSACRRGEVQDVQYMLAKGASFEGPGYDQYEQPIVVSVRQGHVKIVALLIEAGANLEPYGNDGQTPLLTALKRTGAKHKQIFGLLLKAGANVNTPSQDLETPVEVAIEKHKPEVLAVLLSEGANPNGITKNGDTPIFKAIAKHDVKKAGLLLKANVLIEQKGIAGHTPLVEAARVDSLPIVGMLFEKSANPFAKDKSGKNPLDLAMENSSVRMVAFLLDQNPSYQLRSLDVHLVNAVENESVEMAGFLLQKGASPNAKRPGNDPVLIMAARAGNSGLVKALLVSGADPYAKGVDGVTAYVVANGEYKETIRKMLRASYKEE